VEKCIKEGDNPVISIQNIIKVNLGNRKKKVNKT